MPGFWILVGFVGDHVLAAAILGFISLLCFVVG